MAEKGRRTKLILTLGIYWLIVFSSKEGRWSYLYIAHRFTMRQKNNPICTFIFNFAQGALSFLGQFLIAVFLLILWVVAVSIKLALLQRFLPMSSLTWLTLWETEIYKYHLFIPFHSPVYSTNISEQVLDSRPLKFQNFIAHTAVATQNTMFTRSPSPFSSEIEHQVIGFERATVDADTSPYNSR